MIKDLQKQAERSAAFRGHELGSWSGTDRVSSATCAVCGKYVTVRTAPAPNEIDIGGPAVAVGCED